MNLQATQHEDQPVAANSQGSATGRSRFSYASGATPISGYTIKRGIGWGGFGEVYYAVSDGGKEVALKLIRRNFDIELRGVAHCLNLKHPNLLSLYDVRTGEHDDRWVVMEYVTGDSLEDVVAAHPDGLPAKEVNAWMHGLAAGVAYLHECGIVHRDLKPGNIFSDQGLVKIGDYGLSKFISCSRRSGQTESVGTVHYMAPEIANGRYGKEIDIYALGVMLYEMLTGRVPFDGESVGEVLMKHLTAEPELSGLPSPYRSIVGRCLAKDPNLRYDTVNELIADLPDASDAAKTHLQPRVAAAPKQVVAEPANENARVGVDGLKAEPVLAEIVHADVLEVSREEPIWRWIRNTFSDFGYAWNHRLTTAPKLAIIILSIWVILTMGGAILPTAIILTLIYFIYRAVWTLATWQPASKTDQTYAAGSPANARQPCVAKPARRRGRFSASALPVKPPRQRFAELSGGLALSAIVCVVVSFVMLMLRGELVQPEQFAWLALTSVAGAWGVLIPSKLWEGKSADAAVRRFSMLVVLGVGMAAWGLQEVFWVSLPREFTVEPVFADAREGLPPSSYSEPTAGGAFIAHSPMTYLSYFAFLFLLVRWWRLADPLRSTRVSLWATALCVTWAGAIYMFWPFPASWGHFPQPWGFMLAAVIAVAVQLSSPWIDARKRKRMQFA